MLSRTSTDYRAVKKEVIPGSVALARRGDQIGYIFVYSPMPDPAYSTVLEAFPILVLESEHLQEQGFPLLD